MHQQVQHSTTVRSAHIVFMYFVFLRRTRGGAVVEALRYKPEGRKIDSRWCHWNFSLT
jgi:hypothetical protein